MRRLSFIIISFCLSLIIVLAFGVPVLAAENPLIRAIQERGALKVGIPSLNTPPAYSLNEATGELEGYDIDIVRGLAKELNVDIEFDRSSVNLNDLVRRVGAGDFDLAIGKLGLNYKRMYDAFPVHYLDFRHALLADRSFLSTLPGAPGDSDFAEVLQKSQIKIGSMEGSIWEAETASNFPNATFIGYEDWPESQKALFDGRVNAIYRDMTEIKALVYAKPELIIDYVPILFDDIVDQKSIYLSEKGYIDLASFIEFYISKEWGEVKTDSVILDEFKSFYSHS